MNNIHIKEIKARSAEIYTAILGSDRFKKRNILCKFHNETNPSLKIFPNGTFKCFGCGKHGDIFTFIAELNGLSSGKKDFIKTINIIRRRYL